MAFVAIIILAVVIVVAAVFVMRSRPTPAEGPRITIRRGAFAALAADPRPLPAQDVEEALKGLGPAGAMPALGAASSTWAGLGPTVIKGVGRLAKAHLDAFWNLSATIDVDRLRVASDGLSTTITSCHVDVCATPVHGGSPHHLSFGGTHMHQAVVPDHVAPDMDLSALHAGVHLDPGSALDVHDGWSGLLHMLPIGTALTTGVREAKLLKRGDTELGRAAKNVGVDVASVATLSKLGAALGFVVFPPAAVAGGVLGALIGKLAGSRIKSRPLRAALKAHETAWKEHEAEQLRVQADMAREWDAALSEETARYRQRLQNANARRLRFAEELELDLRRVASLDIAEAARRLDAGERRIETLLRSAPSRRAKRLLKADARTWRAEAKRLRTGWQADPEHTEALFDLLLALPGEAPAAQAHAERVRSRRGQAFASLTEAVRDLTNEFARLWKAAVDALNQRRDALRGKMEQRLRKSVAAVEATLEKVQAEARRAGHATV